MPELVHSHLNFPDEPDEDDGRDNPADAMQDAPNEPGRAADASEGPPPLPAPAVPPAAPPPPPADQTATASDSAMDPPPPGEACLIRPDMASTFGHSQVGISSYYVMNIPYSYLEGETSLFIAARGVAKFSRYELVGLVVGGDPQPLPSPRWAHDRHRHRLSAAQARGRGGGTAAPRAGSVQGSSRPQVRRPVGWHWGE